MNNGISDAKKHVETAWQLR